MFISPTLRKLALAGIAVLGLLMRGVISRLRAA